MSSEANFQIKILGRTLEHLGVQMYNRRDTALAELVANAWDAGATELKITLPQTDYSQETSRIVIEDNGLGMDKSEIQSQYLVIGRNRRLDRNVVSNSRPLMGKKGLGKLAGFGIASVMTIETWKDNNGVKFCLNSEGLIDDNNETQNVQIPYQTYSLSGNNTSSGTRITLTGLKHSTPLQESTLHNALARRFSRTVKGVMKIIINSEALRPLQLDLHENSPSYESDFIEETLEDGNKVKYHYVYTDKPIHNAELRGFTILVNGKTAEAPDFYFSAESDVTNQHSSKYIIGVIEADYLDTDAKSESDVISTDRQKINWENPITKPLWDWGVKLCKRVFLVVAQRNAEEIEKYLEEDNDLKVRTRKLDSNSQKQVKKIITLLQSYGDKENKEKTRDLASQVIRAYEYHHFIDVIEEIEDMAESNPEALEGFLTKLQDWKVMESRAILEIIKGRLAIIDKFHSMTANNAPETANRNHGDNMHDLLAGNPWLLNPEWQVFEEEKTVATQLKNWEKETEPKDNKLRYDFLALTDASSLAVIEIKRSGHALELYEFTKLQEYVNRLSSANDKKVIGVLIYGGNVNINKDLFNNYKQMPGFIFTTWSEIYSKVKIYYEHYRSILEGDAHSPSFANKTREILKTKDFQNTNSTLRTLEDRKSGLGSQDYPLEK